jgi:hypothetical protein
LLEEHAIAGLRNLAPYITWIVGIGAVAVVAYRFFRANRTGVDKKPPEPPRSPPHQVKLDPHVDALTSRLEVSGRALVQFEVRIRTGVDAGEQSLSVEGSLTGEDRRLYE